MAANSFRVRIRLDSETYNLMEKFITYDLTNSVMHEFD